MANKPIVISDVYNKLSTIRLTDVSRDNTFAAASLSTRTSTYKTTKILSGYDLSSFRDKANAAEKVYERCPLVQSAIEMYIDIIFHTYSVRHPDKEIQDTITQILALSNIEDAIEGILLDYFKYGNAFPYRFRGEAEINPFDERFEKFEPFMWINLAPLDIDIVGDTVDEKSYVLRTSSVSGDSYILDEDNLDNDYIYHIAAKKAIRDRKAMPPLASLSRAVDLYISYMDDAIASIDNPVPSFVHAAVGSSGRTGDRGPRDHNVKQLIENIRLMKDRGYLVTTDVVEIKPIAVDAGTGTSENKQNLYNNVVSQIEDGLGISRSMVTSNVDGGGSLQWFNITKLVKTLEGVRRKVHKWLDREIKYIYSEILESDKGLLSETDVAPVIRLDEVSLRDDNRIRDILLKMYEKGIVSANTVLGETDLDFQVELNRLAFEKEGTFNYDGTDYEVFNILTPPPQPFQGQPSEGGKPTGLDVDIENTEV